MQRIEHSAEWPVAAAEGLIAAAFGQTGTRDADVNGDGVVNSRDRNLMNSQLGKAIAAHLPLDD